MIRFFAFQILEADGSTYSDYVHAPDDVLARKKIVDEVLGTNDKFIRFFEIDHKTALLANGIGDNEERENVLGIKP